MKNIPKNMEYVHGRSNISSCEVARRPIKKIDGIYYPTGILSIIDEVQINDGQLPESKFLQMFNFCVGQAIKNGMYQYQYTRFDHEGFVPENENNAPFRASSNCQKHIRVFGYEFNTEIGKAKW